MSGYRKSRRIALVTALTTLALTLAPATVNAGPHRAAPYDHQRCGNTSGRVLLTFDDWSYDDPDLTVEVGDYLRSRGIRAVFFLINEFASQYPGITETLRAQGHWVGNHTYSHRRLPDLPEADARAEIRDGLDSTLLRPPFGDYGDRETRIASELGYRMCTWTVDTLDWDGSGGSFPDAATVRARVREAPAADKRGGVVLGHLFTHFPEALPGIIDDLRDDGYGLCRNSGSTSRNIPMPLNC
ncbi:polysaccharide deacetylase family protein [Streptomyces olivoreticuli]|uniref:polysaccharide deacetylase family protein n=1 Tax=Streptomyces olivoreticuli TaxID=68246 RepID=UPI0026581972|nr:polysaccharide deacetylase family protein [Streptomyces olivoreticuli]WKK23389.1 polysaccharide deacetylase family protein [Streptomyces olivoreticuli]